VTFDVRHHVLQRTLNMSFHDIINTIHSLNGLMREKDVIDQKLYQPYGQVLIRYGMSSSGYFGPRFNRRKRWNTAKKWTQMFFVVLRFFKP